MDDFSSGRGAETRQTGLMYALTEALPVKVIDAVVAHPGSVRGHKPDHEMAVRSHSM